MTIYVFAGPTLGGVADLGPSRVLLPPAEQGDVYRAAARRPEAIGLVDGRFQDVPAVWHKEVLWAISQGIPVYGAASMGALRAAELADFGMRGVGWVFEAYRSGQFEDDDEVAIAHSGPEDGFRATSEAMVNIRRTLELAVEWRVLSERTRQALVAAAKELFYPLRGYPAVLRQGRVLGLPAAELDALERWLPDHRVDQKRLDGLELLKVMRPGGCPRTPAMFTFRHTVFFERLRRSAGDLPLTRGGPDADARAVPLEDLLDELRLDAERYLRVRDRALARRLAAGDRGPVAADPTGDHLAEQSDGFRRARGLHTVDGMRQWLRDNDMGDDQYTALMREELALARATTGLDVYLRSQLRVDGLYRPLAERVRAKRALLVQYGLADPSADPPVAALPSGDDPVQWYFSARGVAEPDDLRGYWRSLDFVDELSFRRAVRREFWFVQLSRQHHGEEPQ